MDSVFRSLKDVASSFVLTNTFRHMLIYQDHSKQLALISLVWWVKLHDYGFEHKSCIKWTWLRILPLLSSNICYLICKSVISTLHIIDIRLISMVLKYGHNYCYGMLLNAIIEELGKKILLVSHFGTYAIRWTITN